MARGDAVAGIITVSGSVYQPAAGVEIMITCIGDNEIAGNEVDHYDGTNRTKLIAATQKLDAKIVVTNSIYLLFYLGTGGVISYSGIQTR